MDGVKIESGHGARVRSPRAKGICRRRTRGRVPLRWRSFRIVMRRTIAASQGRLQRAKAVRSIVMHKLP